MLTPCCVFQRLLIRKEPQSQDRPGPLPRTERMLSSHGGGHCTQLPDTSQQQPHRKSWALSILRVPQRLSHLCVGSDCGWRLQHQGTGAPDTGIPDSEPPGFRKGRHGLGIAPPRASAQGGCQGHGLPGAICLRTDDSRTRKSALGLKGTLETGPTVTAQRSPASRGPSPLLSLSSLLPWFKTSNRETFANNLKFADVLGLRTAPGPPRIPSLCL